MEPKDLIELKDPNVDLKKSGIYMIYCEANDKAYIGQSANMYVRWRNHLCALRKDSHKNVHLQRCYNKYGPNSILFMGLINCNKEELTEKEIEIATSLSDSHRLNLAAIAINNSPNRLLQTKELSSKRSSSLKGNKRACGAKREDSRKRMIGNKLAVGRIVSEETRKKMSEAHKKIKHSKESREKMIKSWILRKEKRAINGH